MTLLGTEHRDNVEEVPTEVDHVKRATCFSKLYRDVQGRLQKAYERATCFSKLYRDVQGRLQKAYEKSKDRYNLRHRPLTFFPNQVVWRKNFVLSDAAKYFTAKLADKYVGPV
ncbi:hypothetical protein QE152_g29237 [Popillia japonica]|uniref:Uncharacterized protein n=1 Tax=Popillia japonica TaxID=7064 RepID=A0AAW1JHW1_POPJA